MRGEAGWVRVERERVRSQYGVMYDDGSDLSYLPICEEGVGGEGRKAVSVVVDPPLADKIASTRTNVARLHEHQPATRA